MFICYKMLSIWRGTSAFIACLAMVLLLAYFTTFQRTSIEQIVVQKQAQHNDEATSTLAKGELVMIAASSGNSGFLGIPRLREMVYENRMSYAARWGHEFMWADMSSYNFSKVPWNKIPIIQDAHVRYPKAKWFWWLDLDAIIMDTSLDIYSRILSPESMIQNTLSDSDIPRLGGGPLGFKTSAIDPKDINMLITFDDWGMNTGSFLMRRSKWTDMVLEIWADPLAIEKDWVFYDQDGWIHIFQQHEFVRKHTGFVKQKVINGYPGYNILGSHWEPGELVVHFAGCNAAKSLTKCHDRWMEYWVKRENVETPDWILKEIADGTARIENIRQGKT